MEEIIQYKLSDGTLISDKDSAVLGEEILALKSKINALNKQLKSVKEKCQCKDKKKVGDPVERVGASILINGEWENPTYYSQEYICKVCKKTWYHNQTNDTWTYW